LAVSSSDFSFPQRGSSDFWVFFHRFTSLTLRFVSTRGHPLLYNPVSVRKRPLFFTRGDLPPPPLPACERSLKGPVNPFPKISRAALRWTPLILNSRSPWNRPYSENKVTFSFFPFPYEERENLIKRAVIRLTCPSQNNV